MHLKESAYNFIYDDLGKDQIVFYNSRTGALAVVHEDQYKQYKGFQEKGKEIEDAEFLKNLLKCGYLLPAEVDEKFLIKTNMICGILHVHLRINVDIKNIELANEVVSHLKQENMLEYIHPYLGLVIPYNGTYEADKCLTNELYSKYNLYFMKKNNIPFQTTYPRPRGNHCVSDFYNGWVVDEKGYLYKCWNDIGEISKAVGNINFGENSLQSTKLISEYSSCDFFEDPKCKECKLLPVCMGGCPHSRVEGKTICHQLNFRMKDYLIEYTRTLVSTT